MGANNTPIPDLIEISGVTVSTTYSTDGAGGGTIFGVVDNATYSDDENNNSPTEITELNETTDADNGVLTIDGIEYSIELVEATTSVSYTEAGGGSGSIAATDAVFIIASPTGGGATRYFALFDDDVGDIGPLTSFTTGGLDFDPPGDDTRIDAEQDNNISVVCFVAGTMIATPNGARAVESLRCGDNVLTADHDAQPIIWTGARRVSSSMLQYNQTLRPVRIAADALSPGVPKSTLRVSRQHRLLVSIGNVEVLAPAIKLTQLEGVEIETEDQALTYHHILCPRHEIIFAEGAAAESLLHGPEAQKILGEDARRAFRLLARSRRPARPIIRRKRDLAALDNFWINRGR